MESIYHDVQVIHSLDGVYVAQNLSGYFRTQPWEAKNAKITSERVNIAV